MKQKFLSLYDWCIENNYSILLNEWDYDLNEITPKDVSWGTHKKVYWVCSKCGNIYLSSIVKRTIGRNCPICAGKKVILGYNDFATLCPNLLKEWDFSKNVISPYEITKGSNKKVWWICKKGHEWKTSIAHRTRDNTKCPYCTNEKILKGFNDLETWCNKKDRMDILKRWDYDKNIVKIFEIAHTTNKKYWFRCPNGCSYSRAVSKEIIAQSCPICHKKFIDSERR